MTDHTSAALTEACKDVLAYTAAKKLNPISGTLDHEVALEIEAQSVAEKHGYDTAALRFNRDRYQFGTLALTRVAPHYRAIYSRALAIASERQADVPAIAAE